MAGLFKFVLKYIEMNLPALAVNKNRGTEYRQNIFYRLLRGRESHDSRLVQNMLTPEEVFENNKSLENYRFN